MGRPTLERISQRKYADRIGVSNNAVSKAIKDKKIVKGWDAKAKQIIVKKADEEWGALHYAPEDVAEITKRIPPAKDTPSPADALPKHRAGDFEDEFDDDDSREFGSFNLHKKTTFAEALRVEKVNKARIAEIEYKKLIGELVNKENVYKQLYGFGQSVRQAVLAVPDRCIDSLLVAPNRAEAHNLMTKYLHEALEKLTEAGQLNFQTEEN